MLNPRNLTCAEAIVYEALIAICDNVFATWDDDRVDKLVRALDESGTGGAGRAAVTLISQRMGALFAARRSALQGEFDATKAELDAARAAL
jgi:hypothetical protein